ncbi:MAG: hypothetical protein PVH87_08395 [Desulfobacteraceae bacterium]
MLMHKISAIHIRYVVLLSILASFAVRCAIADEQKNKSMAQLFEAMASLPQSEESLRLEKNMDRLMKALNNLPKSDQKADTKLDIANTLQAFAASLETEDKEVRSALKKWDDYLISINECSNAEHIQVLKSQQVDYYNAISNVEAGIQRAKQYRKAYSPTWIEDIRNRFGKGFLKKNRDIILSNFQVIICRNYHIYEQELKNLIYTEAMLYGSYRKYFAMFIAFYKEKLNRQDQNRLASRVELAEAFLAVINDVSLTSMHNTLLFRERLYENKVKAQNEELFLFFKNHPISRYHNSKAAKDLEKAIQSEDSK